MRSALRRNDGVGAGGSAPPALTAGQLLLLRRLFATGGPGTIDSTLSSQYDRPVGRHEFTEYVQTHLPALARPDLFDMVDVSGRGRVSWLDMLDFLLVHTCPQKEPLEAPFKDDMVTRLLKENRRATTVRLLVVTEPVHTYLSVTASGAVAMYDAQLEFQRGYQLPLGATGARSAGSSPCVRVTDAAHMANSMHFVFSTSDRSLHFYDASATVHLPEYQVCTSRYIY
ncbi:hypothetical protein FJT64_016668 [Amphibalanus amphitrite]|uniref:EF-hand domain-containing protein n=1 Tax=Amphibalanus amphitrite TaxID=1232801 RepID=A0A6A4X515_AMPAM|nr:hypothetical protein FJT64_016668 [Amphibalanus amphitrite]